MPPGQRLAGIGLSRRAAAVGIGAAATIIVAILATANDADPQVNAGADDSVALPACYDLQGTCTDDGRPSGGSLTCTWSEVSGPGTPVFTPDDNPVSEVCFDDAGTYVLRLSGDDDGAGGDPPVTNDVQITVTGNAAPQPNAGNNQTITDPDSDAVVACTCNDDTTTEGNCTFEWTEDVGNPETVTFTPNATTAGVTIGSMGTNGAYTFTCEACDDDASPLCNTDQVVITRQAASGISIDMHCEPTSCTAPCAVHCDAVATTADGVSYPYKELGYRWDFGDPGHGDWSFGAAASASGWDKNIDVGEAQAAHQYNEDGDGSADVYTITLTVEKADGSIATDEVDVTIEDPDTQWATTETTCVSTSGTFTGCPAGATQVTSSDFDAAAATCDGNDRRCLFRRGETFSSSTAVTASFTGPTMYGDYGSGAKPIVNASGTTFTFSTATDIRVVNLDLRGPGAASTRAFNFDGVNSKILIAGNVGTGFHNAVMASVNARPLNNHVAIIDNDFVDFGYGSGGQMGMLCVEDLAVLGNRMSDSTSGEQVLRVSSSDRSVVAHNYLALAAVDKDVLTFRCEITTQECFDWQIHDNEIHGGNHDWGSTFGNGSSTHTDQANRVVIERNWFTCESGAGCGVSTYLLTFADDVVVRDNLCMLTGNPSLCFTLERRGAEGAHVRNFAYNNTCYTADSSGTQTCTHLSSDISSGGLANNLLVYTGGGTVNPVVTQDEGSGNTVETNFEQTAAQADLVSDPPTTPAHYALTATSECIDDGTDHDDGTGDFLGYQRRWNGGIDDDTDCGAYEFDSEPYGGGGPGDSPPTVNAGVDSTAPLEDVAFTLSANCSDDGTATCIWTEVSGSNCTFEDINSGAGGGPGECNCSATDCDLDVTCDTAQSETLRLTCTDDASPTPQSNFDDVAHDFTDNAPTVDAGAAPSSATEDTNFSLTDITISDPDDTPSCVLSESDADGTCTFESSGVCSSTATCEGLDINCDTGGVVMTLTLTCDGVADTINVTINAAGGGSDPASIWGANLIAWYRGDDVTGTTNASAWNDKTANNNDLTQGTGGAQPAIQSNALNSHVCLDFDGGDTMVMASGFTGLSSGETPTVFVVLNSEELNATYYVMELTDSSGGTASGVRIRKPGGNTYETHYAISGNNSVATGAATSVNVYYLIQTWITLSTDTLHIDQNGANAGTQTLTDTTINNNIDRMYVGQRSDAGATWNGDICEIIVVDTRDETKRASTISYIEGYYNIDATP